MITSAEWRIMAIVWANRSIEAINIYRTLEEELQWSLSTVKTLLARLVKKGYLTTEKQGKTYLYFATVNKENMVYQKVQHDIQLLCHKKKAQLIYRLLDDIPMSKKDIYCLMDKLHGHIEHAPEQIVCCCPKGQCTCCPIEKE
ncbi:MULTISPECIES: CopY/TcrY family copper transport repressor [unclassified Granulicatella]|uniref:CopY/TcrY family copper transport repressor n=1 Tax=unclassified Granulicatella TaxID=2630493 RepID=UPI0010748506|nr:MULTISPECIES: CopY/TcrY family copper transport repressor [unclassified Granulicatella]MBF0779978.1 CopY/TcrY family copper transport repressor [Granulicatella sp. 19428wC4_WM01]TFU95994.1 CopY/TcrY family copper transport repressor [Granulicatella sp. WM01]